jgi:hypothetical protein
MGSRSLHAGRGGAEASVRAVLNETILPELVSRQVRVPNRYGGVPMLRRALGCMPLAWGMWRRGPSQVDL